MGRQLCICTLVALANAAGLPANIGGRRLPADGGDVHGGDAAGSAPRHEFFAGTGGYTVAVQGQMEVLAVEWFVPATGITRSAETTRGGRRVEFTAPFSGPAVLYLRLNEER